MKHVNRMLAILLAAMLLCGMLGAVAEPELTLEDAQDAVDLELDDALEAPALTDDLELALEDELVLDEGPEAEADNTAEAEADDAPVANAAPAQPVANDDPFQINADGVLTRYTGRESNVVIPDRVKIIGRGAFKNNTNMVSVAIPASVTEIRGSAFAYCRNLKRVYVLGTQITVATTSFAETQAKFFTVSDSQIIRWAKKHGFDVEALLLVMTQSMSMDAKIGDVMRIYVYTDERVVNYISSNDSIATVDRDGLVTVVNGGTVRITAVLESQKGMFLNLTVAFPQASLSASSISLNIGESRTLTVNNLSGRTVVWSTSNSNVATVRGGLVRAGRPGSCTITAKLSDGTTLQCKVKVSDNARLSNTSLSMKAGYTHKLTISGLANRSVSWSSNYPNVASVQGGMVTAHRSGTCTITAQIRNGKALKCKVTVKDYAKLSRSSLSLKVGGYATLSVQNKGNRSVSWSSNNTGIASVQNGRVTAHKPGTCTITAKLSGGKTLTCKVTVAQNMKLSRTEIELKEGQTFKLSVSNLGKKSVTWSSNLEKVATVDRYGKVTAVKAGWCTITARVSDGTILKCKVTVKRR